MLNFPNVSLLGLNQESRFFEGGFQYASFRRLSIEGSVNDLTETFGITGVWSGEEGLIQTIKNNHDYQDLYLNNVSFGSGRIENINFSEGNDVRLKRYTANITVYDSGNLFNLTGFYYSGIDISNFQYLQTFTENYSFQKKINGGYSYSHQSNIQFTSGVGNLNAIQSAQNLAKTLFTGSNLGLAFYSGYTNKQGKRYFTENYNIIDNTCSFTETFDFDKDLGNYSAIYSNSVQIDDRGIVSSSELGTIRGIENPNYQKALSALNQEIMGSYLRCSGLSDSYFPSGAILQSTPLVQGRNIDIFNNVISYTISFDNSPTNSGFYTWDYLQESSKIDNILSVTENGTVIGRNKNSTLGFENAKTGFYIVAGGIFNRSTQLFNQIAGSSTNFLERKEHNYSPLKSRIAYSYQFSNDPALVSNNGIKKINLSIQNNSPVYSYNHINIFRYKEIIQNNYQSTIGQQNINVQMEGDKTTTLQMFTNKAETYFANYKPSNNDVYVLDCNYTYNPNENNFQGNLLWSYNKGATKNILP